MHKSFSFSSLKFSRQVTPLHMAAEGGHVSIVEYLVDNGARMDVKENAGVSIQIQNCYFEFGHSIANKSYIHHG